MTGPGANAKRKIVRRETFVSNADPSKKAVA